MQKQTTPCPKCKKPVDVYRSLPIATCHNCGFVIRVKSADDPRDQTPRRPGEQKPL